MKSDDVTRLEAAVRSANPAPRPVDLVDAPESSAVALLVRNGRDAMTSTHTSQQLQPAGVGWRRAWAFAAAFVVVLVGIGTALLLLRGGDDAPFVEQPASAVRMGPVTWTRADTGDTSIPHIVALGGGFIGTQVGPQGVEIVASPDGIVWSPISVAPLAEDEQVLWRDGGSWGAIGEVLAPDPIGVIFTPDGSSWIRSDPASFADLPSGERVVTGIAGSEAGLVIAYHLPEIEPPASEFLLSSTDGESWHSVDLPEEVVFMNNLAGTPFGSLMSAEADSPDRPNPGMLTWLSTDGAQWDEVTVTEDFIPGMSTPVGWGGGVILVGNTWDPAAGIGTSRIWHSTDARSWSEVDMAPFEGLTITSFIGSDGGILAIAQDAEGATVLLFSTDAAGWNRWSAADVFGSGDIRWGDAASNGNRLVVPTVGASQDTDLWVGVVEAAEAVPQPPRAPSTPPATATPPTTAPPSTQSLAEMDLSTVADNLWLLVPTREETAEILGMSEHSVLWWDTDSPWFVGMDEWWTASRWGAGHVTMRDNVTPDVAFQVGVFETPEEAESVYNSLVTQRRFTDPSRVVATIDNVTEIDGFGVVLDRYADEAFEIEPEAADDPLYVPFHGLDQTLFVAQRLDRVITVVATHSNEDLGNEKIVEVGSLVADRAARLGELVESPSPYPSRDPQPLPWIIFSGAAPTLTELGIPTNYKMDRWMVEACEWDPTPDRCLEVKLEGRAVTGFDLITEIPWGGFGRSLEPQDALESWISEDVWNDENAVSDFRRFTIGGAPAVRSYTELRTGDALDGAIIEVYMLTGSPMTVFRLMSWEDAGEGIDPELIREALPIIDQLLLEAETNT
ncbi:MAG: hypothetical protein U9R51_07680 [Actinomycetota bacterium]|nr:hypothetical protein [Actinomycetota bacterium]